MCTNKPLYTQFSNILLPKITLSSFSKDYNVKYNDFYVYYYRILSGYSTRVYFNTEMCRQGNLEPQLSWIHINRKNHC